MKEYEQIGLYIYKYVSKEISTEEQTILFDWIAESAENKAFFEEASNSEEILKEIIERHKVVTDEDRERAWHKMVSSGLVPGITKVIKTRWSWWRYSMAAAVLVGMTLGAYFLFQKPKTTQIAPAVTTVKEVDVLPGQTKAVLTLSDGRKIVLDSSSSQLVDMQGKVKLENKEGKLIYAPGSNAGGKMVYNTLSTAKGQIYATELADGSKVWLNSASTIRYPVAFEGKERVVSIEGGEAYFEVAHNKAMPFKVAVNGVLVTATGTAFNIQAYSDEGTVRTTLLEGGVKVTSTPSSSGSVGEKILKPGQQAQIGSDKSIVIVDDVDVDQVMAWKNGLFQFNNDDLKTVLRRVARWYDVEVVFNGPVPNTVYGGKIRMDSKLSEVLVILEKNNIHFRIEGKKIIVTP